MPYSVTKTYGHEVGLSATFRQWRADSHCNQLHGYALAFEFEFRAELLDERNWVIDFGSLKPLKNFLIETFDHKLLVAEDDPELDHLCGLRGLGLADPTVLPGVGCEAFARYTHLWATTWLDQSLRARARLEGGDKWFAYNPRRLRLYRVTVREHGANAASYYGDNE